MTDLETLRHIFMERGIGFAVEKVHAESASVREAYPQVDSELWCTEGKDKNVIGYSGFVAAFYFDATGKLLCVGAWE